MKAITVKHNGLNITLNLPIKKARHMYVFNNLLENYGFDRATLYANSFINKAGRSNPVSNLRQAQKAIGDGYILKPLRYLKQYESMFKHTTNHKPNNSDRGQWLGVEIECIVPLDEFSENARCEVYCDDHDELMDLCGCDHDCDTQSNEGYTTQLGKYIEKQKIKYVSVKGDGSINAEDGYFGAELTILFKRSDRSTLKRLCDVLNKIGAKVNKSCGLHVHLDQRDIIGVANISDIDTRELKRRAYNLDRALPYLSKIVPKSRLNNTYCQLSVGTLKGGRYHAVNLSAFNKYQTIEVRLHSSTTDYEKINNWIDILLTIMYTKEKPALFATSLDALCMLYNIPERLIEYMEKRENKFKETVRVNQHLERPTEESDDRQVYATSITVLGQEVNTITGNITLRQGA
jgi:hypothetical protein